MEGDFCPPLQYQRSSHFNSWVMQSKRYPDTYSFMGCKLLLGGLCLYPSCSLAMPSLSFRLRWGFSAAFFPGLHFLHLLGLHFLHLPGLHFMHLQGLVLQLPITWASTKQSIPSVTGQSSGPNLLPTGGSTVNRPHLFLSFLRLSFLAACQAKHHQWCSCFNLDFPRSLPFLCSLLGLSHCAS